MRNWKKTLPGIMIIIFLVITANKVFATSSIYSFDTSTNPWSGNADLLALFDSSSHVSGTFIYDNQAPSTFTGKHTIYDGSIADLTGTVDGNNFSDTTGGITMGNETYDPDGTPRDFLQLYPGTGPPVPGNISNGFIIGDYTLIKVRMFWIEDMLGVPDFLDNHDLLPTLPTYNSRLALDFVETANPSGPVYYVYFEDLSVQWTSDLPPSSTKVPVHNGLWLIPSILGGLYLLRRKKGLSA